MTSNGKWRKYMLFSIGQASETLKRYYRRKLQGKENVEISDIADIAGGISNYMYSFRLEYDEETRRHSENLILRACTGSA